MISCQMCFPKTLGFAQCVYTKKQIKFILVDSSIYRPDKFQKLIDYEVFLYSGHPWMKLIRCRVWYFFHSSPHPLLLKWTGPFFKFSSFKTKIMSLPLFRPFSNFLKDDSWWRSTKVFLFTSHPKSSKLRTIKWYILSVKVCKDTFLNF